MYISHIQTCLQRPCWLPPCKRIFVHTHMCIYVYVYMHIVHIQTCLRRPCWPPRWLIHMYIRIYHVTSSYITCHIIIHALSHHHTYRVTGEHHRPIEREHVLCGQNTFYEDYIYIYREHFSLAPPRPFSPRGMGLVYPTLPPFPPHPTCPLCNT